MSGDGTQTPEDAELKAAVEAVLKSSSQKKLVMPAQVPARPGS
jgi:hypothetical protein